MNKEPEKILFYLYFLALGLVSSLWQMIFLREILTSFRGDELFLNYFLISWLMLVGLGSLLKSPRLKTRGLATALGFYYLIVGFLTFGLLLAIRILPQFFNFTAEAPKLSYSLLGLPLIVLPVALLLGLGFSWGSNYFCGSAPKNNAGLVNLAYLIETFGFFAGSLAFNFWLINFAALKLILLIIIFCLLVNLLFLIHHSLSKFKKILGLLLNLTAVFAALLLINQAEIYEKQTANWRLPQEKLIVSRNSFFGNLAVTEKNGQYNFYQQGSLIAPAKDFATSEELIHLPLLFAPQPQNILIVGAAWNGYLKEALKYPDLKIVYAELDPQLLPLIYNFLTAEQKNDLNRPRVQIIAQDAISYLKNNQKNFDFILVNLPPPTTYQINRYYTEEFFALAKKNLAPAGVFTFSLPYHPENLTDPNLNRFFNSTWQALAAVFPHNLLLPGQKLIFLSLKNFQPEQPPAALAQNFAQKDLTTNFLSPEQIQYLLTNERGQELLSALKKSPADRNTDWQPAAFIYQLVNQIETTEPYLAKIINGLIFCRWLIWGLILVVLPLLILSKLKKAKVKSLAQIKIIAVLAGSLSLIWEILIIFIWQITFGYIYSAVSLIIGLVMLGIFLANLQFHLQPRLKREKALKYFLGLMVLLSLLILIHLLTANLYPAATSKTILLLAALISGYLAGAIYPLTNKLYLQKIPAPEKETAKIYALELLGGGLLLMVFSLFILPFLGLLILVASLALWPILILFLAKNLGREN